MAIVFKDTFDDLSSKEFGIRRKHAEEAIEKSDAVEVFEVDDLRVIFFLKRVETASSKYLLLVQANEDNKDISVNFAVKLYQELLDIDLYESTPLSLFENFIERYGIEFSFGDFTGKYLLDKKIQVESRNVAEIIRIDNDSEAFTLFSFLKFNPAGRFYEAQCALLFCFNYQKYGEWLKANKY